MEINRRLLARLVDSCGIIGSAWSLKISKSLKNF